MARTITLLVLATAVPAMAAPPPDQVRFAIAPNASDPVWKTPGVKFQKRGDCYRIRSAPGTRWPPAPEVVAGQGNATAPLFNPGLVQPGNTYVGGPTEDNTLYVQMTNDGTGQSIVCRGTILADGKDVTLRDGSDLSARSYVSVSNIGPMGVAPKLDRRRLAESTASGDGGKPQQLMHVVIRQGKLSITEKDWIDLDTGTVFGNGPGADLRLAPATQSSTPTWMTKNGALVSYPPQVKDQSYADCAAKAQWMGTSHATPSTNSAWQVCVRTSEGRLATVRTNVLIDKVGPGPQDWAYAGFIEYVVWS